MINVILLLDAHCNHCTFFSTVIVYVLTPPWVALLAYEYKFPRDGGSMGIRFVDKVRHREIEGSTRREREEKRQIRDGQRLRCIPVTASLRLEKFCSF